MTIAELPRLHLVTDDGVLRAPGFVSTAAAVLAAHGADIALHVRGHGLEGAELLGVADALVAAGPVVLVNDRVDVALAAGARGVQLGRHSLPLPVARRLMGEACMLGYSAHDPAETAAAFAAGADFALVGSIWPSASHGHAAGAGIELVRRTVAAAGGAPVLAIGGVAIDRIAEVLEAGAYGVAVVSGVWSAADPAAAVTRYLEALDAALEGPGERPPLDAD